MESLTVGGIIDYRDKKKIRVLDLNNLFLKKLLNEFGNQNNYQNNA